MVILNLLNSLISELNLAFIGSSDPQDALFFIQRAGVDLIITELNLPMMSGIEFSSKAREGGYTGPILCLADSKSLPQFKKDSQNLNIHGMITKPFSREEAVNLISSTLELSES